MSTSADALYDISPEILSLAIPVDSEIMGKCNENDQVKFTHCGLVTPYGNIDMGHYWLR